jgi:excisionase family DNA binding protein
MAGAVTSILPLSAGPLSNGGMPQSNPELMNVSETADYLRVSVRHVYRLRESGQLSVVKIGRRILFNRADLDQFIEDSRRAPVDVIADRCAEKIREVMILAAPFTADQRRDLAALLATDAVA